MLFRRNIFDFHERIQYLIIWHLKQLISIIVYSQKSVKFDLELRLSHLNKHTSLKFDSQNFPKDKLESLYLESSDSVSVYSVLTVCVNDRMALSVLFDFDFDCLSVAVLLTLLYNTILFRLFPQTARNLKFASPRADTFLYKILEATRIFEKEMQRLPPFLLIFELTSFYSKFLQGASLYDFSSFFIFSIDPLNNYYLLSKCCCFQPFILIK